jgi:hypothetical protein
MKEGGMTVLPEDRILSFLDRCLSLSQSLLPSIADRGTDEVEGKELDEFMAFVNELAQERENDPYLSDETWDWIWKGKPSYNYLQLYGRLAWMNQNLFDLL